jgi:hypothetical protein
MMLCAERLTAAKNDSDSALLGDEMSAFFNFSSRAFKSDGELIEFVMYFLYSHHVYCTFFYNQPSFCKNVAPYICTY